MLCGTHDYATNHLLAISTLQNKTNTCTNSVYLDETTRNEPSHQDLLCFPFRMIYLLFIYLFRTDDPSMHPFKIQIQEWNSPFQKLREERVKQETLIVHI